MNRFFDPDAPLMRLLAAAFDWAALSLTAVLCALPLVTAGASLSALYGAAALSEGPGTFLRLFRRVFRKATLLWLSLLAAGALLAGDVWIVSRMSPAVRVPLWGGLFFLGLCLLLAGAAVFPLAASAPEAPLSALWRRAFFLAVARLPRTLAMLAAAAVPAGVFALSPTGFYALGLAWVFLWPALTARLWVRLGGDYLRMP